MPKERKRTVRVMIGIVLVMMLLDGCMVAVQYRNYMEKMEIVAAVIKEEKSGLDTAVVLLKGQYSSLEKEKATLKEYGYDTHGNIYRKRFWQETVEISIVMVTACGILCSLVAYLLYRTAQSRKEEYQEISQCLINLREMRNDTEFMKETESEIEILRIQEQLQILKEYLNWCEEQAQNERNATRSLVTDLSHQLKTPVAALKVCFSALKEEKLNEQERQEFLNRCCAELEGLEELLAALINISRMETGMIQISRQKRPIFDTLLAAINQVYPKASQKQIEIVMEEGEQLSGRKILHDRKWFKEAIINILDNGIKYSPCGSTITIRLMERSSFLRIEIHDQGPGIAKEEYHKIFKRFYRGSSDMVKQQSGSGVGLYLTREIVRQHQGLVFVKSDRGSTFVIQIPYK